MERAVFFLVLLGQQAHAQLVHFADTAGKWHVADTYPHGSPQAPGFTETTTASYYYVGDTLIGADLWSTMMVWPFVGAGGVPEFIGCAREMDDLVLFRDTTGALDTLYDFSLQPGDSVYYPEPIAAFLHVEQVSSTLIADMQHRVIDFELFVQPPDWLEERWIEGIGSIHGPLFPRYPRNFISEVPGDSLMLTCYERADTLVWDHPGYPDCVVNIIQGSRELDLPITAPIAWPNPGTDLIRFTELPPDLRGATIIDAQGAMVADHTIAEVLTGIDVTDLTPGLYTILLQTMSGQNLPIVWVKGE